MRVFVALFDYDPVSMSPNPDAGEEELPFKEGQLLKVTDSLHGARAPVSSQNLLRASSCIRLSEAQGAWLSRARWLNLVGPCFCFCPGGGGRGALNRLYNLSGPQFPLW